MSSAPEKLNPSIISSLPASPQNSTAQPSEHENDASFLERVLSSFLQERNIRWMLGLGVLILLGSSVSFVVNHWSQMQDIWKYLVLLGYTGAIHVCGQAAYHKLNLRKTGTALMAVTLLLIPLVFFSLHWVSAGSAAQTAGLAFLLCAMAFSAFAARRILNHFFRGGQPAVLISYLALSLFGAIAPTLSGSLSPLWALVAWSIFLFGSIKANREVFWLTEEHRLPRIFGFFPIALLGLQFVAIFALNFAKSLPSNDWFGLCCVMTAIPIMLSADAFARVFKQRTGDLVRPLPWSVIGPIVLGVVLCIAGLVLAATGFPATAYPLVPTAALFAVIMSVTARRTGKHGFVWAMLLGVVLAYQTSPVFFKAAVEQLKAAAANAVNETRLPVFYYGLTYMPLLLVASLVSKWRERQDDLLFAIPLRSFTFGMSVVLFAVSFFHPGANFVVSATMLAFFLFQARIFKQRRAIGFAIAACVTAAIRVVPYVEHVRRIDLPTDAGIFVLAITAVGMQFLGRRVDGWFATNIPSEDQTLSRFTSWEAAALPVTLGAVAWWFVSALPIYLHSPAILSGLTLATLLLCQSMLSPKKGFGELTLTFGLTLFAVHAMATNWFDGPGLWLATTVVLVGLHVFSVLTKKRTDRMARAFSGPARRVSYLLVLIAGATGLFAILAALTQIQFPMAVAIAGLLATGWCLRKGALQPTLLVVGFIFLLAWQCGVVSEFSDLEWLPVAWASTALIAAVVSRREKYSALQPVAIGVLGILAAASFVFFTVPVTFAGGIALVGFLLLATLSNSRRMRALSIIAANWQVIGLVIRAICPEVETLFDLTEVHLVRAALPMAGVLALSSLFFQHPTIKRLIGGEGATSSSNAVDAHCLCLTSVCVAFLGLSLLQVKEGLSLLNGVCAMTAFGGLAVSTLTSAFRDKNANRTRAGLMILACAVVYLALFGVIQFDNQPAMFGMLVAACSVSAIAHIVGKRESNGFAVEPLSELARLLPLGTVAIALVRFGDTSWLGTNSLAVLISAGYYFWCGIEEKRDGLIVLAAIILNFALVLMWKELHFHDPQFFMIPIGISVLGLVELLKREIPNAMRNPLRYAGALMILVSPTFNIVHGSWLHMFSLLICAVLICIAAIGLRTRPLLYAGTAFLVADIIAMVILGVSDHPDKLWLFGLGAGAAVIALAAFFENQRANLTSRMRMIAAELNTWD